MLWDDTRECIIIDPGCFGREEEEKLRAFIAQEQLKVQMELVQKEKRRKENLLGILAHDVKNPINNLGSMFELYQDDLLTQQEFKELMKGMQARIEDVQGTIDGILGQLNTEIKQEKDKEGSGNPVFITEKVIKLLQYKLDSKNQKVQFLHAEASGFTASIGNSTNQISIILKNLIDNGHKYSDAGTLITVRVKEIENQVVWEVEDEGPGIPIDKQKQLFTNTLASDQGTGMALYLCQTIAESIAATITYLPKPKASVFRLSVNL